MAAPRWRGTALARLATWTLVIAGGCSNDWDSLDPRLDVSSSTLPTGGAGAASSGGGGHGASAAGGFGGGGEGGGAAAGGGQGGESTRPCGDGTLEAPGEECDDGNARSGDGCSAACTVECAGFLDPASLHCYELHPGPLPWEEARDACLASGPGFALAALTSQEENDLVLADPAVAQSIAVGLTSDIYIGATDVTLEGSFEWVTGEPWQFTAWTPMQPDDYLGEDCAELWVSTAGDTGWNDQPCIDPRAYLCERAPAGR
jgi:cysteine-rich repeat protein